jgi:F-type H+-transporting ATPase subunit epsilon
MPTTFHFDLVSPEKLAFSGEVDQVDVPGVEGDFGVLAGYAPVVAAIRPGILTVFTGGTQQKIIVLGGLAEVSDKGLTVLAGHAPVVAAIRPGILTVFTGGTQQKIIVLGGLAEVSDKGLTVLADVATSLQDLDKAQFADKISDMEAKLDEKEGSELDRAIERLDHFKSIQGQLNSTAMH